MTARARGALLLLGVALLVAAGCQMQLDVDVVMAEDGSGTVAVTLRLDADALTQLGGDIGTVVDLDRLADSGWTVGAPVTDGTGETSLEISQAFEDPSGQGVSISWTFGVASSSSETSDQP